MGWAGQHEALLRQVALRREFSGRSSNKSAGQSTRVGRLAAIAGLRRKA